MLARQNKKFFSLWSGISTVIFDLFNFSEMSPIKRNVLDKMNKMRDSFALQNQTTKEAFSSWLSVGNGEKYFKYIIKFDNDLKKLLKKYNANHDYEAALNSEDWEADEYSDESLSDFFDKFPKILDFFAKELEKENSQLEQIHEAFWSGYLVDKLPTKTKKNKGKFAAIKNLHPEVPNDFKAPSTTATVLLILPNGNKLKANIKEYEQAVKKINASGQIVRLSGVAKQIETTRFCTWNINLLRHSFPLHSINRLSQFKRRQSTQNQHESYDPESHNDTRFRPPF